MNPHRDRLFRAMNEAPADAGTEAPPADEPFEPGEISFADEGDVGRQVRENVGLTHRNARGQFTHADDDDTVEGSGPAPLAPPAAPAAPAAPVVAAPAAPPATGEPPVDGGLGEPQARYTLHENGSVTLANGHTYATTAEAMNALWHAQDLISRGAHKAPEQQAAPPALEPEEEPRALLGTGAPLGGDPETVEELLSWAEANPAAAGRWVVANQVRINDDALVSRLYAWWGEHESADRDNYMAQLQKQQTQQATSELESRIMEKFAPYIQAQEQAEITRWDAELEKLPYFTSHYSDRVGAEIQSDPAFVEEYRAMSAAEKYRVCKAIYAELRVDDSIAAANGQPVAQAAPGGAVAAGQAAAATATTTAPPVVEGRGGAAPPPIDRNNTRELVRRGVAAYQQAGNLFSPDAPAT